MTAPVDQAVEAAAKLIYETWKDIPESRLWQNGGNSLKQDEARRIARQVIELASQQEVAAPVGDAKRDAVMRHDYPVLQQFHTKHAMGPLAAPSCLCCGKSTQGVDIGVQHLELPGIVICMPCKEAASRVPVALVAEPVIDCDTCGQRVTGPCNAVDCTVPDTHPGAGGAGVMDARPDSVHSDSGECDRVQGPGTTDARREYLQPADLGDLMRFDETTGDDEGYDIGKPAIKRLAELGVVQSHGFGKYSMTEFGGFVLSHMFGQNPTLPLVTNEDRNRAAILAKGGDQ